MRRWGWLLMAALLFAFAAWLMLRGEEERPAQALRDRISLPRRLDRSDEQRQAERRTWVVPAAPDAGAGPVAAIAPRDPVFAAISAPPGASAVVIEANAIRHSRLGELLVACMNRSGGLHRVRETTGIDPLTDIDRVAAWEGGLLVSGNFRNLEQPSEAAERKPYGDHGELWRRFPNGVRPLRDGGSRYDPATLVKWRDELIVFAETEEDARTIVDRLEGRAPLEPPLIDESLAYGEIYGVLSARDVARMLPDDQRQLAETLEKAASRIELHADTMSDVGLVADVRGPDAEQVKDLGKSLGAALAVGRMQASASGDQDLAQLMELARVVNQDGRFRLELALPIGLLEQRFAYCRDGASDGGL